MSLPHNEICQPGFGYNHNLFTGLTSKRNLVLIDQLLKWPLPFLGQPPPLNHEGGVVRHVAWGPRGHQPSEVGRQGMGYPKFYISLILLLYIDWFLSY